MPKRYEDASDRYATLPNASTWNKLNAVLFPVAAATSAAKAVHVPAAPPGTQGTGPLAEASIEEIVSELKRRGATSVVINW